MAKPKIPRVKRVLLLAAAAPLGSCMTLTGPKEPLVPDGHNFSYVAPDRKRIHMTQAFDDGSKTYLQFDDTLAAGVDIRDPESGYAVMYTVEQRYVIVPWVYGTLGITVGRESATVVNQTMPTIASPGPVQGESGAEPSPRQIPTNHDHDGETLRSIHEFQSDQPSIPAAPAAVRLRLIEARR